MCALFVSAGNGNACTQMSQDRQRGEENCKIERLRGINLSIDSDTEQGENFIRPGQRLQICIPLALALKNLTSGNKMSH